MVSLITRPQAQQLSRDMSAYNNAKGGGARGGTVGWGTALQAGRSWVYILMGSLENFIDIILPATKWPWVDSACNTNKG